MSTPNTSFSFEISLTVLNHLGRQLYRNFITILGEAVSNAWDADAEHVEITYDRKSQSMLIVDDGEGMDATDLQHHFLRIGYSKRKDRKTTRSARLKRAFIGAKGIGKLALLSCADMVSVASLKNGSSVVGCLIDNSVLDVQITNDGNPHDVQLGAPAQQALDALSTKQHGTALYLENVRVQNSTCDALRRLIALFFTHTIRDESFEIRFNDDPITVKDLTDLAEHTQFIWVQDTPDDPYLALCPSATRMSKIEFAPGVHGFIASVHKPSYRQIRGTGEHLTVDLYVNGRLREKDILRRCPDARLFTQYLYGQIHFDELDATIDADPFTSSREGVVDGNEQFDTMLDGFTKALGTIASQWDSWRRESKQTGDAENKSIHRVERASEDLAHAVGDEVAKWIDDISHDANDPQIATIAKKWLDVAGRGSTQAALQYQFLFTLENLARTAIRERQLSLSGNARAEVKHGKHAEQDLFTNDKVKPSYRRQTDDPAYVGIRYLLSSSNRYFDDPKATVIPDSYKIDEKELRVIAYLRNIVMHTSGLNDEGVREFDRLLPILLTKALTLLNDDETAHDSDSNSLHNRS